MNIKAIKHIRRLRGGSQAQLMAADDGHEYVVKFQGNPQTTRVLANDYLAAPMSIMTASRMAAADATRRLPDSNAS